MECSYASVSHLAEELYADLEGAPRDAPAHPRRGFTEGVCSRTVERRGAAARALPPTIPAVLFLGRNVLPSCQHRSQRNTAKGPLRREVGRLKSRLTPTIPGIRLHP